MKPLNSIHALIAEDVVHAGAKERQLHRQPDRTDFPKTYEHLLPTVSKEQPRLKAVAI